jgi:hypothetical protein
MEQLRIQQMIVVILILTFSGSFLALANLAWRNYKEDNNIRSMNGTVEVLSTLPLTLPHVVV